MKAMRAVLSILYVAFFSVMCCVFTVPGLRNGSVEEMIIGLTAVMSTLGPVAGIIVGSILGRGSK